MRAIAKIRSIKIRLILWFLIVAVVPLLSSSAVMYFQRAEEMRSREFNKLISIRDLKVRKVNNWLDERTGDIITMGGFVTLRMARQAPGQNELIEARPTVKDEIREYLTLLPRNYNEYREVMLLDPTSGRIAISTNRAHEGEDRSREPYFTKPLATGSLFIRDIYYSKAERELSMAFALPLFSKDPGLEDNLIGVLVSRIDLEQSLYDLLRSRTGMGKTGETLIVNRDVYALNELRWHENAPLELKITAEPAVQASRGYTGITESADYRGEMVLSAYSHIPRTGWGFVAKQDLSELYHPITVMLRNILIILAVSVTAIYVLAAFLAGNIARPVISITEVSNKLVGGDLKARNEVHRADEIGFLAGAFNRMADSLVSRITVQRQTTEAIETLAAAATLQDFGAELTRVMAALTGSFVCAFYLRTEDGAIFKHVASVGADKRLFKSFDASQMEGELGLVLAEQKIQHIKEIPKDTAFIFKATAVSAIPSEIITVPIMIRGEVQAAISLAALRPYSTETVEILERTRATMSAALANILASEKTERLAEELRAGNEELQRMNEELRLQSEELQKQTEELAAQAETLERQRLQVAESDRLKSEFLSNMSHELRTPLNSILALSQLMISQGTGRNTEEEHKFLQIVERNGRNLLNLINDILDLSKIEAGRLDITPHEFSPELLIRNVLEVIRPMAEEKGLNVALAMADVGRMYSDEDRVKQILLNLLSNAVKFTELGEVRISAVARNDNIVFEVSDTGIGIAQEDQAHAFDEFRQVDGSTTRRFGGSGLGLSISLKLAKTLGGDLSMQSTPGAGSMFTLVLPLRYGANGPQAAQAARDAGLQKTASTVQPRQSREKKRTIMLVEDDEIASRQMHSALEEEGYAVITASGGAQALDRLSYTRPDAIILDLMMPEIGGYQVLEKLRANESTAETPVLILTAKDLTKADRARLAAYHVQQFVQKGSLDRTRLIEIVRGLFAEKPGPAVTNGSQARAGRDAVSARDVPILVVEDNRDNMTAITAILANEGFKYVTAENGEQAVSIAKDSPLSLILMDIQLPVMSGLEAATIIKADPELAGVPVIALTARAMKGDREKILSSGCDDYLSKPIDPQALIQIVNKWTGRL